MDEGRRVASHSSISSLVARCSPTHCPGGGSVEATAGPPFAAGFTRPDPADFAATRPRNAGSRRRCPRRACLADDADLDVPAVGQDAQLLQLFQLFQGVRRQVGQGRAESDGDRRKCRGAGGSAAGGAAKSGWPSRTNGMGLRLKYSARPAASQTTLTQLGLRHCSADASGAASVAMSAPASARTRISSSMEDGSMSGSSPCTLTTQVGVEAAGDLGDAVGAAGVVAAGHFDAAAEALHGGGDAGRRWRRRPHRRRGPGGAFVDVLDEVLAGLAQQRLAGQAAWKRSGRG